MSGTVTAGLIILIVLVVLLLAGVPIGISLSVASMAAIVSSLGYAEAVSAAALRMFRGISIFTLLAIPFFILAGNIMNKGGKDTRVPGPYKYCGKYDVRRHIRFRSGGSIRHGLHCGPH